MKTIFLFTLAITLIIHCPIFTQDKEHSSEISSSIPELSDFHEVIYPIWHTAYPDKDIKMMKEMKCCSESK
jgi:hypothetical protein